MATIDEIKRAFGDAERELTTRENELKSAKKAKDDDKIIEYEQLVAESQKEIKELLKHLKEAETGEEKEPWFKRTASYDISGAAKKAVKGTVTKPIGAVDRFTQKYTPTFRAAADKTAQGSPGAWLIIAALLWLSDRYITEFNGVNIDLFFSRFTQLSPENISRIFFNGIVLTLLLTYWLVKKPNAREFLSFFVLIEVGALIFSLGAFNVGLFHLLFAICLYLFYLSNNTEDRVKANYILALFIAIDFFGFGIVAKYVANPLISNRLIIPIWVYYIFITAKKRTRWMSVALFLIILINIFAFTSGMTQLGRLETSLGEEQLTEARGFWTRSTTNMKEEYLKIVDSVKCAGKEDYSACVIEEDYKRNPEKRLAAIEGQVDTTKKATKISFSKEGFPDEIRKSSYMALSMDMNIEAADSINIITSCKLTKDGEEIKGTTSPSDFFAEGTTSKKIRCELPTNYAYEVGKTYNVIFEAELNPKTTFTTTRLFIGHAAREDVTLDDYDMTKTEEPKGPDDFASFTVSIGKQNDPFLDYYQEQTMEGKLTNRFKKGEIIEINSVQIHLPEGVYASQNCLINFHSEGNTLVLKQTVIDTLTDKSTITCPLEILAPELTDIGPDYQNLNYQKREFSSTLGYSYKISEKDIIKVV